jgi:SAM-dependent methyltransferase
VIRRLEQVVPAAPDKPARPGAAEHQAFVAELARSPERVWTPELAAATVLDYERLAPGWNAERGGYRRLPVADALARGGPWPAGVCLELGSGTGLITPLLATVWPMVVGLDLSPAMLGRAPAGRRVLADSSRLPVADGVAACVVLADSPLFAAEVVRVLAPAGVVLWSNALGPDAPYHLPTATVRDALSAFSSNGFHAVESLAGWGSWAVLRRSAAGASWHDLAVPNSVVVYTVRAEFDDDVTRDRYVDYLRGGHCLAVVRQGGALSAEVTVFADGTVDSRYLFGSQADFDDYESGLALELRADWAREFPPGSGVRTARHLGVRAVRVPD